jgi:DOPA 4,5-dioxygenase
MEITDYHFHLYYDFKDIENASVLREKMIKTFHLEAGRLWDRPVGPHPIGSCQLSVAPHQFYEVMKWVLENRNGVDLFIHPNTGNALVDHSEHVIWIGKSYELNLSLFENNNS